MGRGGASIGIGTLRFTQVHHEELEPQAGHDDLDRPSLAMPAESLFLPARGRGGGCNSSQLRERGKRLLRNDFEN